MRILFEPYHDFFHFDVALKPQETLTQHETLRDKFVKEMAYFAEAHFMLVFLAELERDLEFNGVVDSDMDELEEYLGRLDRLFSEVD
jgi:hypothetical protein